MVRAHAEIQALVQSFCQLVDDLPTEGPTDDDFPILRRALYGLHAILMLHLAQEDQSYLPLLDVS
jgi:hypothetical protein